MFYQKKAGFYVYHVDREGCEPELNFRYFANTNDLFLDFSEWQLAVFFGEFEKIYHQVPVRNCRTFLCRPPVNNYFSAYDEQGNYFSPDRLVGLYRQWRKVRYASLDRKYAHHRHGRKRRVWAGYRVAKTMQERRMAFVDPDAVESDTCIRLRASRGASSLPDSYSDICRHADKSWKMQSTRQHQWR